MPWLPSNDLNSPFQAQFDRFQSSDEHTPASANQIQPFVCQLFGRPHYSLFDRVNRYPHDLHAHDRFDYHPN